jgi:hypothetical protein
MTDKIGIYGFNGPYRWLSNFEKVPIVYEGITYPSVENAYQAAKFVDSDDRLKFEVCNAFEAKKYGKEMSGRREDWQHISIELMTFFNRQKYAQEPFKQRLIDTRDLYIEETNTWGDVFWGVCNGTGENHLGLILMKIREELQ